jgi:uncharacterized protein (TIGR03083 family)
MGAAWQANIEAYGQTARSMVELGTSLGPADWDRPTECPGWSVKDQFAHVLGVERWLLGEVRDDVRRTVDNTDLDVGASRDVPPAQIVRRLRDVVAGRLEALRSGTIDLTEITATPFHQDMPYGDFMGYRAFDVWMHEQDVRRATGRPGNLHGPAADCAARILGGALPFVVGKRAAAEPGTAVVVETPARTWRVEVGDDRRARFRDDTAEPSVRLRMDWETFIRLTGGRMSGSGADVRISGDRELGGRILDGMAVTP